MNLAVPQSGIGRSGGLLIDTNLLVLFIVGSVNLNRIENFKRTRKYSKADYVLLLRVIDKFEPLYTLAHVMAEVSNLSDLTGRERIQARQTLKSLLAILQEPVMPSLQAAQSNSYNSHGLVDAAIASLASDNKCTVLTDDLDLYLALNHEGIAVLNFTHLQAREWGV
jgi:rRNA-processing protein FCF1